MISIVDDDPFVRSATENLLVSLGYEVITFASAEEFLASGQADDTSCLITDVAMPGLTGLDLQQRLMDDGKHVPIIFMTAFFSQHIRAQALARGAVGFLGKPYRESCLIKFLTVALDRSRGQSSD
jgi:FixJ family two-component response regulator